MSVLLVVTLVSLVLAAVMSGVAWRAVREERRRSEARIDTLAAAIAGDGNPFTPAGNEGLLARPEDETPLMMEREAAVPFDGFDGQNHAPGRRRIAIALGALVVGTAAVLAVVLSAGAPASDPAPVASTAAAVDAPLELVALEHTRSDSQLTVRGVVRNPPGRSAVNQLSAVVFVLNREGGLVASGRSAVEASALTPGAESAFAVTIPGVADISRYRVSFRIGDVVIPHVDRRVDDSK